MAKVRPAVVMNALEAGRMPLRIVVPITDWKASLARFFWFVRLLSHIRKRAFQKLRCGLFSGQVPLNAQMYPQAGSQMNSWKTSSAPLHYVLVTTLKFFQGGAVLRTVWYNPFEGKSEDLLRIFPQFPMWSKKHLRKSQRSAKKWFWHWWPLSVAIEK